MPRSIRADDTGNITGSRGRRLFGTELCLHAARYGAGHGILCRRRRRQRPRAIAQRDGTAPRIGRRRRGGMHPPDAGRRQRRRRQNRGRRILYRDAARSKTRRCSENSPTGPHGPANARWRKSSSISARWTQTTQRHWPIPTPRSKTGTVWKQDTCAQHPPCCNHTRRAPTSLFHKNPGGRPQDGGLAPPQALTNSDCA